MTTPARTTGPARVERAPAADAPRFGVVFLATALVDPVATFARARGRRYWVTAAVLLGLVMAADAGSEETHPFLWVVLPVFLLLSLMLTYPLTSLARVICSGPSWLTDATASQTVVITAAALLPGAVLGVLGFPALTTAAVSLVLLVIAVVATVALWSTAFACRWPIALVAYVVTSVVGFVVLVPVSALIGPTVEYLTS